LHKPKSKERYKEAKTHGYKPDCSTLHYMKANLNVDWKKGRVWYQRHREKGGDSAMYLFKRQIWKKGFWGRELTDCIARYSGIIFR